MLLTALCGIGVGKKLVGPIIIHCSDETQTTEAIADVATTKLYESRFIALRGDIKVRVSVFKARRLILMLIVTEITPS